MQNYLFGARLTNLAPREGGKVRAETKIVLRSANPGIVLALPVTTTATKPAAGTSAAPSADFT